MPIDRFASDIAEIFALMSHNHIGNYLLVGRIRFGLRSRHKTRDARNEYPVKIAVRVKGESLKDSYLFEDFSLDNQYMFFLRHSICPITGINTQLTLWYYHGEPRKGKKKVWYVRADE